MPPTPRIPIDRERIADFCRRHHVRKLALFGSVLRDDFGPWSDVDVLFAFEDGYTAGWMGLAAMDEEMSAIMGGRKVDLVEAKYLKRRIKAKVIGEARVQYAA